MPAALETLPLTETIAPATQAELETAIVAAHRDRKSLYPLGGGTSLDYGLVAKTPGLGLSLVQLNQVVDYPARDMTITVEAGIRMADLARVLAAERQWLPIEVPHAAEATIGGAVASAWCGARRYGWGSVRDYVIGIQAIDGRGMPFQGGGRVVKNVAGYDFCKLLTGSLGTIGVISQVTFKVRPLPPASALVCCSVEDWTLAEKLLAALVHTQVAPAAIELVGGAAWDAIGFDSAGVAQLVVGLDGTRAEIAWMVDRLTQEWREQGVSKVQTLSDEASSAVWTALRDFSASSAPLVVKASVRPSSVVEMVRLVLSIDPQASFQAHAGNGIVLARFSSFEPAQVSRDLIGKLQPAAVAVDGHWVVLSSTMATDLTRQAVWGGAEQALPWMSKVKQQFDPHGLLNPGRFLFA